MRARQGFTRAGPCGATLCGFEKFFEPWLRFRFVPGGRRRIYAKQMIILRASGLNARQAAY